MSLLCKQAECDFISIRCKMARRASRIQENTISIFVAVSTIYKHTIALYVHFSYCKSKLHYYKGLAALILITSRDTHQNLIKTVLFDQKGSILVLNLQNLHYLLHSMFEL